MLVYETVFFYFWSCGVVLVWIRKCVSYFFSMPGIKRFLQIFFRSFRFGLFQEFIFYLQSSLVDRRFQTTVDYFVKFPALHQTLVYFRPKTNFHVKNKRCERIYLWQCFVSEQQILNFNALYKWSFFLRWKIKSFTDTFVSFAKKLLRNMGEFLVFNNALMPYTTFFIWWLK